MDCIDFTELLFAILVSPVFLLLVSHDSSRGDFPVWEIKDGKLDLMLLEIFSNFNDSMNGQSNSFIFIQFTAFGMNCGQTKTE